MTKKNKCLHKHLKHLENDQMRENVKYNDKKEVESYDDFKVYIFLCEDCTEIIIKTWLRCHFEHKNEE